MEHEFIDFGNSAPSYRIAPFNNIPLDVVGDKLYLFNTIYYVVKSDPKTEKFKVRAVGVCHFKPAGDVQEGLLEKFQIYCDASPVFARVAEVASLAK